jgi:hypothetical protein
MNSEKVKAMLLSFWRKNSSLIGVKVFLAFPHSTQKLHDIVNQFQDCQAQVFDISNCTSLFDKQV